MKLSSKLRLFLYTRLVVSVLLIIPFAIYGAAGGWLWIVGILLLGFSIYDSAKKLYYTKAKYTSKDFDILYNDDGIFTYSESGFTVKTSNGSLDVLWTGIKGIMAYKIDRFAYDTICLDVFCEEEECFGLSEETPGWFVFMRRCKEQFPSISPSWEVDISTPAFEAKLTLMYSRDNLSLEEAKKTFL